MIKRQQFIEKWKNQGERSRLAIGITPRLTEIPAPIARYDDPFLPFGRAIIECTADFAGAYVFDLAAYLAIGAAGAIALERTIPFVPTGIVTILHGPFGSDYAGAMEAFAADSVTLNTADEAVISAYTKTPATGVFIPAALTAVKKENPQIGFYTADSFDLAGIQMTWITEAIIYASGGFDYQDKTRQAAEQFWKDTGKG